jgi:hypothetical protein
MVATLVVVALVLAVGVGVWAAWRRDVSGAFGSLISALFMGFTGALLFPRATAVWIALGLGCFAWWVIRRLDRTTGG